jgi:hypothetical protein
MQSRLHATRLVLGAIAALALLAAMSAAAAAEPLTSDQFAPGWQAHAKPLFYVGMSSRVPGRDRFQMPGILQPGEYVLVRRHGDKAELIDGQPIRVSGGNEKQYIFLDPGTGGDVEAIPVSDVPALNRQGRHAPVR